MTALERIDIRIGTLEALLEELRDLRNDTASDEAQAAAECEQHEEEEEHEEEPAAVKPAERNGKPHAAKPAKKKAVGDAPPKGKAASRIRDLLAAKGPLKGAEIAAELGKSQGAVSYQLSTQREWFTQTDPSNRMSPWTLTEAGQKAGEFRGG